jgi:hypothetical protein
VWITSSVLEPVAVVAGLKDMAVVREAVQERGGHLGIAEHAGALIELAEQVKQQSRDITEMATKVEDVVPMISLFTDGSRWKEMRVSGVRLSLIAIYMAMVAEIIGHAIVWCDIFRSTLGRIFGCKS